MNDVILFSEKFGEAGPVSLPSNAGSLDPDQPSPATKISSAPAPGYAYNDYDPTDQPS